MNSGSNTSGHAVLADAECRAVGVSNPRRLRTPMEKAERKAAHKARQLVSLKGQPKPYQRTLIRMQTARHLAYLEVRGLADFSGCNLFGVPNKYPKTINGKVRMVPVTDGSPTGGV